MGNSCTRSENQVVLSEGGGPRFNRNDDRQRGRWSEPGVTSVDIDMLLEAPSPPPVQRRRKSRVKSKSERVRNRWSSAADKHAVIPNEPGRPPQARRTRSHNHSRRKSTVMEENENEDDAIYRSYEDPGYMVMVSEPMHFDSDCILGSPPDSPTMIHARWGEPVDDPDEESVCTEFRPNPFKLGFCVNCQKQHEVTDGGSVVEKKEYKKIARPVISKTAANAAENPAAVRYTERMEPQADRESDVDLAALLRQRRDILMKLSKIDQEQAKKIESVLMTPKPKSTSDPSSRHTMLYSDNTSLANLRRMPASTGRATTAGFTMVPLSRGTSLTLSPRSANNLRMGNIGKSVSLTSLMKDDEEPAVNDWL